MSNTQSIINFHNGQWVQGNVPILGSADHGTWLGTLVFDGARYFDGVSPDLRAHCDRVNRSAVSLGMTPTLSTSAIVQLVHDGIARFTDDAAVYIRPMYWSTGYGEGFIDADPETTDFCLCLQQLDLPAADATATLTVTKYHRPTLDVATVDAKAACLYPNNARMIREAMAKGFTNALVCDALGNVAETATSNIFMVRDGEVYTPVPNGCFLNGITRQRIISLLRDNAFTVHECTLSLQDFHNADEVFMSGNMAKVTPVTAFDETHYSIGKVSRLVRELYMEWARS